MHKKEYYYYGNDHDEALDDNNFDSDDIEVANLDDDPDYDDSDYIADDDYDTADGVENNNSHSRQKQNTKTGYTKKSSRVSKNGKDRNVPVNGKKKKISFLFVITILFALTTIASVYLNFYILKKSEEIKAQELAEKDAEFASYIDNLPVSYTQDQVDEMVQKAYDDASLVKEQEFENYLIEKSSQKGPSLYEVLRVYLTEYVVFSGNGQFYFEPINYDYALNTVNQDNLVVSENVIKLIENDETISKMGIDVSEYQGNIDWGKVADAGVEFAIMRAGYRGYGTGKLVQDAKLIDNIEGALKNNIEVGVYFFTQAISKEEIQEEVDTVMSYIEPYDITGPIVIDVEKIDSDSARGNALSKEERTELVKYFCDAVRKEGYTPMIYGNTYSLFGMLDINQVHDEKIWYAYYTTSFLYYPYKMDIWQYSDKMTIPGIKGNVDIDIMFP